MPAKLPERLDEIVADLEAESASLDALFATRPESDWTRPTPAAGWDVRDSVAHIAIGNDLAVQCLVDGRSPVMDEMFASGDFDRYERDQLAAGRARSAADVHGWWRESVTTLAAALRAGDPDARIPWGPVAMSPRSFATARLMETWAHGLDCFEAFETAPVDTERLRHIARLGWRSLPYAFAVRGLPAPGPVQLRLVSPAGEQWVFGDDDAASSVTGAAGDWCRVATHRDRRDERSRLRGAGPDGDAVIAQAQAYLSVN